MTCDWVQLPASTGATRRYTSAGESRTRGSKSELDLSGIIMEINDLQKHAP